MSKIKSSCRFLSILLLFVLIAPVINKALPSTRSEESHRAFFPKEKFLTKIRGETPEWMQEQLERDFSWIEEISLDALDKTFEKTRHIFHRYRILNNCLYKHVNGKLSGKDNELEKAIKTLLIYARVPNVDFIICHMDGLPEKYMPPDFYFCDNQAPIFAKARLKSAPFIILIPDQFSLGKEWHQDSDEILKLNSEIAWDEKREMALWRGGFTDIGRVNGAVTRDFRKCPRFQICKMDPELVDAKLPWGGSVELEKLLKEEDVMGQAQSKRDHLLCKYLPVLDGHMCTYPGYQWRLLSTSVCFKQQSDQEQWFYSALKPYVHYVPVQNDLGDLIEKINWAKNHDDESKRISENGRLFALNHLMPEDVYYYLYLVLLKYASKQKIEFNMDSNWECIQYRKRRALIKSIKKLFYKGSNAFGGLPISINAAIG